MTLNEANEVFKQYLYWEDRSCSCHTGNPTCARCLNMPDEKTLREDTRYLDECFLR